MKNLLTLSLLLTLVMSACQPGPSAETPMPVETNQGDIVEAADEVSEFAYSCEELYYWEDSSTRTVNADYEAWAETLNGLLEDIDVYDLGDRCELNDGSQFISLASMDGENMVQKIVQLDADNEVMNQTATELIVRTAGDLGAPRIEEITEDTLSFAFYHGDGPCLSENHFELDRESFNYELTDESTDCGDYDVD